MELASSKTALDEQYKRWRTAQENYERQVFFYLYPCEPFSWATYFFLNLKWATYFMAGE
jgi:hypothetical protein